MELKNLESFIQVAELGSFTRAARRLGYTQSTISFQIRQLETELETPLFERIRHTVRLTAQGREVLKLAHQMVQTAEDMRRAAGEDRSLRGMVRIAMADSLCGWLLKEEFREFVARYPDIRLTILTGITEEMFQMMNENQVDLVYTLDSHIYNRSYVTAYEEPVQTHFIVSPDSPLAGKSEVEPEELLDKPMIFTEKNVSYRKLLEERLASMSLAAEPFLELGDTILITQLVSRGLGCGFLPDFVTQKAVEAGEVVRLNTPKLQVEVWKQLLYHRDKWVSPEMQAVMECLGHP